MYIIKMVIRINKPRASQATVNMAANRAEIDAQYVINLLCLYAILAHLREGSQLGKNPPSKFKKLSY